MNSPSSSSLTVVGAGPAGLWLAVRLAAAGWPGRHVQLLARGWGSWSLCPGTIDISADERQLAAVLAGQASPSFWGPDHPYVQLGAAGWQRLQRGWQRELAAAGLPFVSRDPFGNFALPTLLGTVHPAWLAPLSLVAGDLRRPEPILLVGCERLGQTRVDWVGASLRHWARLQEEEGRTAPREILTLDIPADEFRRSVGLPGPAVDGAYPNFSGPWWGRLWEHPASWTWLCDWLPQQPVWRRLGEEGRVLLPLLGWEQTEPTRRHLAACLGRPVGELLGGLPSAAGVRLGQALQRRLSQLQVTWMLGRRVERIRAGTEGPPMQPKGWQLAGTVEETGEPFVQECTCLAWAGGWEQPAPVEADDADKVAAGADSRWLLTVGEAALAGQASSMSLRPGSRTGTLLASAELAYSQLAAIGQRGEKAAQ